MKINSIQFLNQETDMVDLGIADDNTFYVGTSKEGPFYLTHNSMPDIDCIHIDSKIVMADGSHKTTCYVKEGDMVLDLDNRPQKVLAVKRRPVASSDRIYTLFININGTYGTITANHKHRLILDDGREVTMEDVNENHYLMSPQGEVEYVGKIEVEEAKFDLCDITVEGSSTFQIVPFNVLEDKGKDVTRLKTIDNYSDSEEDYNLKCSNRKIHSCLRDEQYIVSHNSDFSDRQEALELITEFFGEENVIAVSNFAQLQIASLCKDLARIYGVPPEVVNAYTIKMRNEAMAVARREPGFDAATWDFNIEAAKRDSPSYNEFMESMEQYPEFKGALEVLFKQQRTCFPDNTKILTDNGYKKLKNIDPVKDAVGYCNAFGEIKYNKDYEVINQGSKELYTLIMEDGSKLELTGDHKVFTVEGYKEVKQLTEEDSIICLK